MRGSEGGPKMPRRKKNDDRSISEMRNLGPVCERDLNAIGIYTAAELIRCGAVAAFLMLRAERARSGRETKSCNAIYLYALYGAIHDIDWRAIPQKKKDEFKKLTAELRAVDP